MARVSLSLIKSRWRLFALVLVIAMQVVWTGRVEGAHPFWNWKGTNSVDWAQNGNWQQSGYPQAQGDEARFSTIFSPSTFTVNVNSTNTPINFGSLIILTSTSNFFVITGSEPYPLIFNPADAAQGIFITSMAGFGSLIEVPLHLKADLPVQFDFTGSSLTIQGTISEDSGTHGLKTSIAVGSGGKLILSGSNTYHGVTEIDSGTTIQAATNNTFSPNSTVNVVSGGSPSSTLDLNGNSQIIGALTGSGNVTLGSTGSDTLTLGNNNTPSATFNGVISGSGGLIKVGTGTQILSPSSPNTYNGSTTISNGILETGNLNALPTTTDVTVNSPGILDLNSITQTIGSLAGNGTVTLGSAILTIDNIIDTAFSGSLTGTAGIGGLIKNGSGTFILSGNNITYSGPTTINVGALQLNDIALAANITDNASLVFDVSVLNPVTYGAVISGTGSVTKQDSGTLILNQNNIYSGGTFIGTDTMVGGTLQIATGGNINNGNLTFGAMGGTLHTTGSVSLNVVTLNGLSIFNVDTSTTLSTVTGVGGLTKLGGGTLILSGTNTNTYSGSTNINAGTLQAAAINTFSPNSTVIFNSGILDLNNSSQTIGALAGAGSFTLGINPSTVLTTGGNGANTSFSGVISGQGSLVKDGSGTMILLGQNSYSGDTLITGGGVLQAGTNMSLPSTTSLTVDASSFFKLNGYSQTLASLEGGGIVDLSFGTLTTDGGATPFSGIMVGSGGLTKVGAGTLILSGSTTYSGPTLVNDGTLQGGAPNAFSPNSTFTVNSPSTLDLGGFPQEIGSLAGDGTVLLGSAILTTGGNNSSTTFSGFLTGTAGIGGLIKNGTGTFTLEGGNISYSGPTTINGGALQLNDIALAGNITDNASLVFDVSDLNMLTYGAVISGTGSVTKQDSGTLILTQNNFYSGGTFIGTDTMVGGTLKLTFSGNIGTGSLTFGALGGTLETTNNFSFGNSVILNGAAVFNVDAPTTNTTTLSGSISGIGSLTKIGDGTLALPGTGNSYSGGTFIGTSTDFGGLLIITNDGSLGNATSPLTFGGAGGTLEITSDTTSSRPITLNGPGTFAIDTTTTLSGTISGPGSLIKNNSGTLILTGTNSYSGGTVVNGGILQGDTNSLPESVFGIQNNNSILIFNQNFDDSYSSSITGSGAFFKTGSGALTLLADGSEANGVTVNGGVLNIEGNFSANKFTVTSGTTLGAINLIGDIDVLSGGTLTPAYLNTVGNMFDQGTVHFFNGSNYAINFDMTSPGSVDYLEVNGNVFIDDVTTLIPRPVTTALFAFEAPILHTTNGGLIYGNFTIDNPYFLLVMTLDPSPPNPPTDTISLRLQFLPFTDFINCGNPGRVAAYFDLQNPPVGTDFNYVLSVYRLSTSVEGLFEAFDQLHPALFSALTMAQENSTMRLRDLISDRASELFFTACDCNIRRDFCDGWWMSLLGDVMNQKQVSDGCFTQVPFDAETGGVVFGTDTIFRTNFTGGICGGFDYTRINWDELDDKGTTDTYFASLYASGCILRTLFDASIIGAFSRSQADRAIEYLELDRTASHIQNNWLWNAHLGAIYPIFFSCFSLSPFAQVDYFNEYQEAFKEHGAESLDLEVAPHRADLLRSEGGLRFSFALNEFKGRLFYEFKRPENLRRGANVRGGKVPCCGTRWIPTLTASYIQEWRFMGTDYTASMPEGIGTFQVEGLNPNRRLVSPTAEILILNDPWKWSFSIRYGAEFNKEVLDQNLFCKLSYDF